MYTEVGVVQKIHDNVVLGLHYTIFCIRINLGRIYGSCAGSPRRTAGAFKS